MAPAAEHDLRRADQAARRRAQALDAVLADADDGQPARRCGSVARRSASGSGMRTHPHSRRHHRSAACWPSASPGAAISTSRCRSPAAPLRPRAASRAGSQRRLWRRRRPRGLSRRRAHRRPDRRHASLRQRHLGERSRGRARQPTCRSWRCAARPGLRSPATAGREVSNVRDAVRTLGRAPRRVFVALGRNELAPSQLRRSITISSAASIRSIRRSPLPHVELRDRPRAVQRSRRPRAA